MKLGVYRELLAVPGVPTLYLASFIARLPMLALPLALTLYVVEGLDRGYGFAGVVAAAEMVGVAVGSPWRGAAVDKYGVRRTLIPSLLAVVVLYPLTPFVGYWGLVVVAFGLGLLMIPVQTIVRLSLSVQIAPDRRRTAFAADSVVAEAGFIIGPAAAAIVVAMVSPVAALLGVGGCIAVAGVTLFVINPITRSSQLPGGRDLVDIEAEDPAASASGVSAATDELVEKSRFRTSDKNWLTTPVLYLFVVGAAAIFVLLATELSIVAALREFDSVAQIGVAFGAWGGASLIGGLYYGARPASIRPSYLLLALGLLTVPIGFSQSLVVLSLALVPAGLLCAPTLAATTEYLAELVDEQRRGTAMGWQATAYTVGGALASPVVGITIDRFGAAGGFAIGGMLATTIAVAALGLQAVNRATS